ICAICLPPAYTDPHADFQELARLLDDAGERDLLIFAAPTLYSGAAADLFLGYSHYANPRHRPPVLIMTDSLSPQVRDKISRYPHVWLINASSDVLPTQLLPDFAARGPLQTRFAATIWEILPKPKPATRPTR